MLTGIKGSVFSTMIITIFGEIFPKAYFSRHALKFGSMFSFRLLIAHLKLKPEHRETDRK